MKKLFLLSLVQTFILISCASMKNYEIKNDRFHYYGGPQISFAIPEGMEEVKIALEGPVSTMISHEEFLLVKAISSLPASNVIEKFIWIAIYSPAMENVDFTSGYTINPDEYTYCNDTVKISGLQFGRKIRLINARKRKDLVNAIKPQNLHFPRNMFEGSLVYNSTKQIIVIFYFVKVDATDLSYKWKAIGVFGKEKEYIDNFSKEFDYFLKTLIIK